MGLSTVLDGADRHGARLRALIVVRWRAGRPSRRRSRWADATLIRGADRY